MYTVLHVVRVFRYNVYTMPRTSVSENTLYLVNAQAGGQPRRRLQRRAVLAEGAVVVLWACRCAVPAVRVCAGLAHKSTLRALRDMRTACEFEVRGGSSDKCIRSLCAETVYGFSRISAAGRRSPFSSAALSSCCAANGLSAGRRQCRENP